MSAAFIVVFGFAVAATVVLVFLTARWAIRRDIKARMSQRHDELGE